MSTAPPLIASKVIPVLRYSDADTALYAADIAIRAGFNAIELTWTIPDVLNVLQTLRQQHGNTLQLGVGTLTTTDQAHAVLKAGADFLVSPGLATDLIPPTHEAGKLFLVGAFTPSEVMTAIRAQADIVKIFPADSVGPAHLAALRAVFSDTVFCPTGGISAANMHDYFQAGANLVGIGSSLYDKRAFAARDTEALLAGVRGIREAAHGKRV